MCQKSLRVIGYNANLNHQCKAVRNDNHVLNDESLPRQLFDWTNKHVLLGYGHHKDGPRFRWVVGNMKIFFKLILFNK